MLIKPSHLSQDIELEGDGSNQLITIVITRCDMLRILILRTHSVRRCGECFHSLVKC